MDFGKTKDALTNISFLPEISVEEALGFFLDFCDDCGGRIDKLPVKDSEAFLKNLRKCNRLILDIIKKYDMNQIALDAADRINKQKESMDALEKELEEEERMIFETSKDIDGQKTVLADKKDQIRGLRDRKTAEVFQIEKDMELLQKGYDNLIIKNAQLRSEIQDLGSKAENAKDEFEIIYSKKEKLEKSRRELIDSIENLSKETKALEKELEEKKPVLEKIKLTNLTLQNDLNKLNSDLNESNDENKKLKEKIKEQTDLFREAQLTQSDLQKQLDDRKKQLSDILDEVKKLRGQYSDDSEDRYRKELESRKAELLQKKSMIESLKQQSESLSPQISSITEQLEAIKTQVKEKEKEKESADRGLAKYKEKLAVFKSRAFDISAVQEKTERLKNIAALLERDGRIMAGKFGGTEFNLDQTILSQLLNADDMLKKVRSEIENYIDTF